MNSEGASIRSYRDLKVWSEAMLLAQRVYALTAKLPPDERFGLVQQLRRCAISVPSNIAEGHARGATRDFARFIAIARGSLAEMETQLDMCLRLDMAREESVSEILCHAMSSDACSWACENRSTPNLPEFSYSAPSLLAPHPSQLTKP